jgi:hypothetical protein
MEIIITSFDITTGTTTTHTEIVELHHSFQEAK